MRQGDDRTLVVSDHALCRIDWTADGGASCSGAPGFLTPVGAESGRVWALTVSPPTFMPVFALSAVTGDRIDSLMLGAAAPSAIDRPRVTRWDFVPWVFAPTASHVLFPEVRDGFLVFDRLPAGKPVLSITSRWIARGDHTGIDLYPR